MNHLPLRLAGLALVAAAGLAGCGGGGGDGDGNNLGGSGNVGNANDGSEVPFSARQSISGLVAYLNDLIANRTDEVSAPVVLGDITLPTSETSEPLSLN